MYTACKNVYIRYKHLCCINIFPHNTPHNSHGKNIAQNLRMYDFDSEIMQCITTYFK